MNLFKIMLLVFIFIGCSPKKINKGMVIDGVYTNNCPNKNNHRVIYKESDTLIYSINSTKDYTLSLKDTNLITLKFDFSLNEEVLTKNKRGIHIDSLTTYLHHTREVLIKKNKITGKIIEISIFEDGGDYYSVKLDATESNIVDFNWDINLMRSWDYIKNNM